MWSSLNMCSDMQILKFSIIFTCDSHEICMTLSIAVFIIRLITKHSSVVKLIVTSQHIWKLCYLHVICHQFTFACHLSMTVFSEFYLKSLQLSVSWHILKLCFLHVICSQHHYHCDSIHIMNSWTFNCIGHSYTHHHVIV